jgi:ABC-2 type transport system ATP-binding protein
VLLDQSVASLRRGYIRKKRITLQTVEPALHIALPGVRIVKQQAHRTELEVDVTRTPVEQVVAAVLRAGQLQDLTVEDPPLDEIVQAIYAGARTAVPAGGNGGAREVVAVSS